MRVKKTLPGKLLTLAFPRIHPGCSKSMCAGLIRLPRPPGQEDSQRTKTSQSDCSLYKHFNQRNLSVWKTELGGYLKLFSYCMPWPFSPKCRLAFPVGYVLFHGLPASCLPPNAQSASDGLLPCSFTTIKTIEVLSDGSLLTDFL